MAKQLQIEFDHNLLKVKENLRRSADRADLIRALVEMYLNFIQMEQAKGAKNEDNQ